MDNSKVIEQYYQLRSCRAVADLYGCSSETIRRILKAEGVSLTGWKQTPEHAKPKKKYYYPYERRTGIAPAHYEKVCEYCGGIFEANHKDTRFCTRKCKDISIKIAKGISVNPDPKPQKKICAVCGKEYETRRIESLTCSAECAKERAKQRAKQRARKRYPKTREEHLAEVAQKKEERDLERKAEKERYLKEHTISRNCIVCGTEFDCLDTESKKTCSGKCSKRLSNSRHDRRIQGEQKIDNIRLPLLYKRDNGVCYLCGGLCDWNDWRVSDSGNKYPGDNYPTVEHVIPISRGGLDSWENVRLAHWKCNIDKGTSVAVMPAANKIEPKTGKKKTEQYSKNGDLLKIWESTAQIKRALGFSDSYIQNVCRGEAKTAYGYIWKYAT